MTTDFRDAHEWATGVTGAGVLAEEGELSWKNKVRQRFSYYYDIVDIMADRAGSMPKCLNDDPRNLDLDSDDDGPDFPRMDDDDDDEEEEEKDDESVAVVADSVAVVVPPTDGVVPPTDAVAVAVAPPFPPPSGKKDKKPRKRGGRTPLMDDETLKAFSSANDTSAKRFREERRHNQRVEDFENRRLVLDERAAQAQKLATHVGYVAARVKSVSQHHELKAAGCSDEQIILIVPDLKDIVEIITGKKFPKATADVDESDDGGGKPAAKDTPERRTSPRRETRNNGK